MYDVVSNILELVDIFESYGYDVLNIISNNYKHTSCIVCHFNRDITEHIVLNKITDKYSNIGVVYADKITEQGSVFKLLIEDCNKHQYIVEFKTDTEGA